MCIPCWPWADVYIEDGPKKKKQVGVLVFDPIAKTTVRMVGVPAVSAQFLSLASVVAFSSCPLNSPTS